MAFISSFFQLTLEIRERGGNGQLDLRSRAKMAPDRQFPGREFDPFI